jgi:RimJ/RimL family protein N-acetyltransferase
MSTGNHYLFTSPRLGFRTWSVQDIVPMSLINADPEVMAFFPAVSSEEQTREFVERMQRQFDERGYCYYAVDRLDTGDFIGFIGLSLQTFEADFTPCVDIGWRLRRSAWGQGFATEGARRCLEYAFEDLDLICIYAVAPKINSRSEHIMKAIGMEKLKEFSHPLLATDQRLRQCVLYRVAKD